MRGWLVVVATLLNVGCQGQRDSVIDPAASTATLPSGPAPTPPTNAPSPASATSMADKAATSNAPQWWCADRTDGVPGFCHRRVAACQHTREKLLKIGLETKECVSQASAFCFTASGPKAPPV